jgi:4-amino-4-deoxy-L-arabinose transferase-like glycosyltransferase
MMKLHRILFPVIVLIALFLRIYHIDQIPPSLSWDEVSIGYNAYSILKTGKDEHGRFLPLDTFIAYGDYKPPIPIYVTVPFVAVFGLTEFAVRLPVAILGTATVFLTYYVVFLLFEHEKKKTVLALISTAVLACSPWHVNLSRAGFEAVIALFFFVLCAFLFLKARKNRIYYYWSFLPLVACMYTFNSARYIASLFGLLMLWYVKDSIQLSKKEICSGVCIAFILLLPLIPHLLSAESRLRFKEVNIFSNVEIVKTANRRIEAAGNTIIARIIHNRRVYYSLEFLRHYLHHFEANFLFIRGDGNPKFSTQDTGQLYIVEAPLLIIGILALLSRYPRIGGFLLLWLALAIIPAATARETPHALRILNTLPTWQIFIGYGIVALFSFVKTKNIRIGLGLIILGLYSFYIFSYLHTYHVHYPVEYSGEWQYGYREAFRYAETVKNQYKKIVVTDYIGRPYAYALFYGKYPPEEFWQTKDASFDAAGFYNVYAFGPYEFIRTSGSHWEPEVLYILQPDAIPQGAKEVFRINLLNGKPVLVAFHI